MQSEQKSEYDLQAEAFLAKHSLKIETRFLKYDKYFEDDKQARDIYEIVITGKNPRAFLKFTFGQSISNSTLSPNDINRISLKLKEAWKKPEANRHLIGYGKKQPPTAYDVLACLEKYSPGTFEDWAANLGYDTDSRKAEKTWKSCVEQWFQVEAFFTAEQIAELQEIN